MSNQNRWFLEDRVAGGSYLPQAPSEPYVTVSRHTAQAFLKLSLAGPPGCFSNNEIYSYFIAYILECPPGKYCFFSRVKRKYILLKETLGLYAVCYFNNLCDTHLQSFHSLKLLMGAPANAVICFPILSRKETPARVCLSTPAGRQLPFGPGDVGDIRLNPYPSHYKTAFAFSCILHPHFHQCALRFHLPYVPGEDTGFPRSTLLPISG